MEEIKILKTIEDENVLSGIKICKEDHFYGTNEEKFNDSFSSAKLIEDYFIYKRNLSNVLFDEVFSLIRISTINSMLRSKFKEEKINIPKTIANLNYLDVIIAIFFFEEFCVFKYGMDSSSFGNLIPKILYQNSSKEFLQFANEFAKTPKIESGKKTPIPKAKNSLKKILLEDYSGNTHFYREKEKSCYQCNKMLNLSVIDKIEDFIEKLTVFTYNN